MSCLSGVDMGLPLGYINNFETRRGKELINNFKIEERYFSGEIGFATSQNLMNL